MVLQYVNQSIIALRNKLFLVEYKGNNVSWKPENEFKKGAKQKAWVELSATVKTGFKGVKLKETPIFYKGNNINKENDAINKIKDANLNKKTIEQFWNILKEDKYMAAMYFTIGNPSPPSTSTTATATTSDLNSNGTAKHLLIRFENDRFQWYPSAAITKCENPDWDDEYSKLKTDICNHFNLDNSNATMVIEIILDGNEVREVEDGDDIDHEWSKMIKNKRKMFIECIVSGATVNNITSGMKNEVLKFEENDFKAEKEKIVLSPEMVAEYDEKLMKFNFNEKHNAEKEMTLLLDNILFRQAYEQQGKWNSNGGIVKGMLKLIDRLLESLKREGHSVASMVVRNVTESRDFIKISNDRIDWENAYRCMKQGMNGLRPFNIDEMLLLYDKTAQAAKQIENQDAVLILGHTGAGKFFLCCFFLVLFVLFFFCE